MLASGTTALPADEDWAAEVKWDGMRAQLRFDGRRLELRSRPGRLCTEQFPELMALSEVLGRRRVLLDGELVCRDTDGRPDFERLRGRLRRSAPAETHAAMDPARLMVFDVLHLDGHSTRSLPYRRRRELLTELALEHVACQVPDCFPGQVHELAAATRAHELEGVVLKRLDLPYRAGQRSGAWLKYKHRRSETLAVAGWVPHAETGQLHELLLAREMPSGELVPAGRAAYGLSAEDRECLLVALRERARPSRRRRGLQLVRAGARVTVEHHGRPDGPLRDPVMRAVLLPE